MKQLNGHKASTSLAVALMAVALSASADLTVSTNDTVVTVSGSTTGSSALSEPFQSPDVSSVVFDGHAQIEYSPTAAPTYAGGTVIKEGQLFVSRGDALGTGPVRIGTAESKDRSALFVRDTDVTLGNKVIFAQNGSYAAGFSQYNTKGLGKITLTSVGTPADGASHSIRFGRLGENSPSRVTLALTGSDSEAIDRIETSGSVDLVLDGGTLKARPDAQKPFISQTVVAGETSVKVTTNGLTVDVAEGGTVDFGRSVDFATDRQVTVLETLVPENDSFQDGATGWSIFSGSDDKDSAVKTSPSPFDGNGDYPPPGDDKNFMMLRRGATLSRTVKFPSAGLWRVRYWRGCRPGGFSKDMTTTVKLNGTVVQELPPGDDPLAFAEHVTEGVEVPANQECLFEIVVGNSTITSHSLNFDAISFERVQTETVGAPVTKTGAGTWAFAGADVSNASFTVMNGALNLHDLTVADASVTVAPGATVRTFATTFAESARVSVQDGGTWVLSDLKESVLQNGSFEAQQYDFSDGTTPTGWALVKSPDSTSSGGGLVRVGHGVLAGIQPAEGDEVAFLRVQTALSQTVTVPEEGTYRLSFARAFRKWQSSFQISVTVSIDGVEIGKVAGAPGAVDAFESFVLDEVFLSVGEHTIRLESGTTENPVLGEMVFIDDVKLQRILSQGEIRSAVRLQPGATLVLENDRRCWLRNVWVGEEKLVTGNAATLANRGVVVQGAGKLRVGAQPGAMLIFR